MHIQPEPIYKTELGALFCADSLEFMQSLPDDSIDLVLTSPPYALHFKKEYGNASQEDYVAWFLPFAREIERIIKPSGSFIEFLTDPGDMVLDPFAGSNTTGYVAEGLKRKWIGVELRSDYAEESRLRFEGPKEEVNISQSQQVFSFD